MQLKQKSPKIAYMSRLTDFIIYKKYFFSSERPRYVVSADVTPTYLSLPWLPRDF
jgi:hypothetical protein